MTATRPADELQPVDYAREHWVPRRPNGKPVNQSTLWRWIHKGLAGTDGDRIKLAVTYAGSRPCVTRQGIADFFQAVTEARMERHQRSLEMQTDVSDSELAAAGLA